MHDNVNNLIVDDVDGVIRVGKPKKRSNNNAVKQNIDLSASNDNKTKRKKNTRNRIRK